MTIQDPVFKIPTAWEWNGTFQREIGWGTTIQAGYVGRRGIHNQIKRNINQLLPGTLQANPGINTNALRPYLGMGVIDISENAGLSRYNGLQISVQHRFTNNLQFGIAYTFSRSTDNGSSLTDVLPNAYNTHTYFGPSDFDRTHVLVSNYIYKLPCLQEQASMFFGYALGGWEISGIINTRSGTSFFGANQPGYRGRGNRAAETSSGIEVGDSSIAVGSFTPRASCGSTRPPSRNPRRARSARNRATPSAVRHTGRRTRAFARISRIVERLTMQFRFEVFDFLNHPNWGAPSVTRRPAARSG